MPFESMTWMFIFRSTRDVSGTGMGSSGSVKVSCNLWRRSDRAFPSRHVFCVSFENYSILSGVPIIPNWCMVVRLCFMKAN